MSKESHSERPTPTVEDYLLSMYVMERDQGEIVAARLAELLNVTPATVATTLKRMKRDGWITDTGRKSVYLTTTGRQAAASVIRRHMLAEWMLVKFFQIPLYETHQEAHNIEHAISSSLEKRMVDVLGELKVCPHGNPFPGHEQTVKGWLPLTQFATGEHLVIRRVHEFLEDNQALLMFLSRNDIRPGVLAVMGEVLPFNQTLSLYIESRQVTLGFSVAALIFAERLPPP